MGKYRILLVDDSNFFIEIERAFLERSECEILTACSGEEAMEIIGRERPDLVLLDLYLRGIKGDECCRRIKGDPATSTIPVIMVTSAANLGDRAKAVAAGCDDFITKPVNKITLLNKIKQFIDIPARDHVRVPLHAATTYWCRNREYTGVAYVISEGGIFIKGESLLPVGERIRLRFGIADIIERVEAEGTIVWNTAGGKGSLPQVTPGMGIRFDRIGEADRQAIRTYINLGNYLV